MRRALDVLVVLGVLAVLFTTAAPSPAYADDSATLPRVATVAVDSPDSLLPPSGAPAQWWGGGWGGWPWWAGMPLWSISAVSGGTWPWAPWYWTPQWWTYVALANSSGGWPFSGGFGGWPFAAASPFSAGMGSGCSCSGGGWPFSGGMGGWPWDPFGPGTGGSMGFGGTSY